MRLAAALAIGASLACRTCHSQLPRDPFDDLAALAPEASQRGQIQPCVVVQGQDLGRCAPSVYYRMRGAAAFKRNQVEESCDAFDESMRLDPGSAGRLWQRGLSLFYAERLVDGMAQFANDVALNPNDTEETVRPTLRQRIPLQLADGVWCLHQIWHFLCNARHRAQTVGASRAVAAAQAELLSVGRERRPVMAKAMALYGGTGSEAELLAMGGRDTASNAYFYTHLYLGLWMEANGRDAEARQHILNAANSVRAAAHILAF